MRIKLLAYTRGRDAQGDTYRGDRMCGLAAATCTSQEIPDAPTGATDRALERALESGHESVIEHWSATFAVEGVSRALTHQLVRHRVASYSQQSQRYVSMDDADYIRPASIDRYLEPATPDGCPMNIEYVNTVRRCFETYRKMIEAGIPEEDARYVLPNACTTNIIITMNARELRHFFSLRCCERAQWEIRQLANVMLTICRELAPAIFADAGPPCHSLGYCREERSCGRAPKLCDIMDTIAELDGLADIRDEQRTAERECH